MISKLLVILIFLGMGFSYNARYGGELYQDGKNAQNAALGGLSVSYADGYNPVLLRNKQTPSIHFSHKNKFGGLAQVTILSYLYTRKKYPIYFGITNRSVDNIPNTSSACDPVTLECNYYEIDHFSQQEIGIRLSTIRFWGPFTLGFNLKPSFTSLVKFGRGYGIAGDVAALIQPLNNLNVTLLLGDIIGLKYWDSSTVETVSPLLMCGIHYHFSILKVGLEIGSRIERNPLFQYHIGIEYKKQEQLLFRLGTSYNSMITAGIGIKLPIVDIDYAYLHSSVDMPFNETHVLSAGISLDDLKQIKGKITP